MSVENDVLRIDKGWWFGAGSVFGWTKDGHSQFGVGIDVKWFRERKTIKLEINTGRTGIEKYTLDVEEGKAFVRRYKAFRTLGNVKLAVVPQSLLKPVTGDFENELEVRWDGLSNAMSEFAKYKIELEKAQQQQQYYHYGNFFDPNRGIDINPNPDPNTRTFYDESSQTWVNEQMQVVEPPNVITTGNRNPIDINEDVINAKSSLWKNLNLGNHMKGIWKKGRK